MANRTALSLTGVVLAAVIGLTGCSGGTAATQEQVRVARGDIVQSVSADGELSLTQDRQLTFGVDGKIEVLNVEEGAQVTKGQVLAKLEAGSLERAVSTAELAIKSAGADRQQAEAGVLSAKAELKQAEAGVGNARADLVQAGIGVGVAEADLKQSETAVKTAEADLDLATSNYRKITYPYTYSTFAFDVPQAMGLIGSAEQQLGEVQKGLQAGLSADQYAQALTQLQQAMENLVNARQRLSRGQGEDVLTSGLLTANDYWTLRAAQLAMDKAQLAVDTARGTESKAHLAVDKARSMLDKAQLAVDIAQATLDKAQAGVLNAQGVLSKAQLAVDRAGYDRDGAKETLAKATITAPFDGIVARVDIKVGDVLTPLDYTRTIFEIIDPRRMEFTIKVDELDIAGVEAGQQADISIDALPGSRLRGQVSFVSPLPTIEGGVVQYQVKVGFDVPDGSSLRKGMSSTASIVISQRKNVLLLPDRAVSRNKAGKPVVKLLASGQLQEKVVEAGISNNTDTEIISGLSEGDTVVIERPAGGSSGLSGG